ncbi:HlyD family secretion protein [Hathewaya proteolytica DSM 3090]|uniref:HlyD family secretion protein n=1 Tax=Hathewaya proteolytica DSM 3090 TaxID=1121331 RepID=A0A1M6K875_9CLOT|nr:HlyD family efflux transporter periplasmic adaptor subunit [Hathewaya proteolytica]SHJ55145.1 HlyD family secretion protein [Hathewaya proteolytica DSM 3090]
MEMNLKVAEENVKLTTIKSPCDGVMNIISRIKEGDYVQSGTPVISIVPERNESFNIEIYIPNENLGEIKENQEVSIELLSLPGREYGYLKSKLKNISVDAKIKSGMMEQAKIINRRASYFRYFLEKIDILD